MAKTIEEELNDLKHLVKEFLEEIEHVPFSAVDCDQETVHYLLERLENAVD